MTRPLGYHDSDDGPDRRKSTLCCWECDHQGPVESDWTFRTRGPYVQVVCPRCETVVGERPRTRDVPALRRRPMEHLIAAWGRSLRVAVDLWANPFDVGASPLAEPAGSRDRGHRTR